MPPKQNCSIYRISKHRKGCNLQPELEFLNNLWVQEPSRNRVVVTARHATQPCGTGSWESIIGLLKSFKIRALSFFHFPSRYVAGKHPEVDFFFKGDFLPTHLAIEYAPLILFIKDRIIKLKSKP
jgi:hypothetical protein